jgi:integrase
MGPKQMPRATRDAKLETRSARLNLAIRRKPYSVRVGPGVRLGYRRNTTAGSWSVLAADGHGGAWLKKIGLADDYEDADGKTILTFWEAQAIARKIARGEETEADADRPLTVAVAIELYAADLKSRGGTPGNATRLRHHVPPTLASRPLALTDARDWRNWRDGMVASGTMVPSTINRIMKSAKACCNHAAALDQRIRNKDAWTAGLASLRDAERARRAVLDDATVRKIVTQVHAAEGKRLGLFLELMATVGARPVQISRLLCGDLDGDRVMMPSSLKGRGQKAVRRGSTPVPPALGQRLAELAAGRCADAPLFEGAFDEYAKAFRAAVAALGLDSKLVPYSLRHSSITRSLLAGVPVKIVASLHDTSSAMIEKNYGRYIADHADAVARRGLLDLSAPDVDNVIPLTAGRERAG